MSEFEALKEVVHWLWKCHGELEHDTHDENHPKLGSQQYLPSSAFFIPHLPGEGC